MMTFTKCIQSADIFPYRLFLQHTFFITYKFSFLKIVDYSDESEYDMPEMRKGGQQPSAGNPARRPFTSDTPARRPYTAAGDPGHWPQPLDDSQDNCPALHTAFAHQHFTHGSDTCAGSSSRRR